jgi:hypothetical protein
LRRTIASEGKTKFWGATPRVEANATGVAHDARRSELRKAHQTNIKQITLAVLKSFRANKQT